MVLKAFVFCIHQRPTPRLKVILKPHSHRNFPDARKEARHAKQWVLLSSFSAPIPIPLLHYFTGPWVGSGRGPGRTPRVYLTPVRPTDVAKRRWLRAHWPAEATTAPESNTPSTEQHRVLACTQKSGRAGKNCCAQSLAQNGKWPPSRMGGGIVKLYVEGLQSSRVILLFGRTVGP